MIPCRPFDPPSTTSNGDTHSPTLSIHQEDDADDGDDGDEEEEEEEEAVVVSVGGLKEKNPASPSRVAVLLTRVSSISIKSCTGDMRLGKVNRSSAAAGAP